MKVRTMFTASVVGAALLFVAAGCGVPRDAYQRDIDALGAQIGELEGQKDELAREKRDLEARVSVLAKEKGRATEAMLSAMTRVQELEAIATKRQETYDKLRASLQGMVSAGKLRVVQKRGMLVVEMAEAILFDSAKSELKEEGRLAVAEMTAALASIPGRRFQVAGHTDDRGSEEFNWQLSADRALSVLRMMREAGMPGERISIAGYAWYMPDVPNDTDESRARNRRIEIILVPNLDELQL